VILKKEEELHKLKVFPRLSGLSRQMRRTDDGKHQKAPGRQFQSWHLPHELGHIRHDLSRRSWATITGEGAMSWPEVAFGTSGSRRLRWRDCAECRYSRYLGGYINPAS
jgi:hypothetical protein